MREDDPEDPEMMEAAEYVTDAPVATSVHPAMRLRKPLLHRGPGRRREDRGRQGDGAHARDEPDPPAVLRRARRLQPRSTSGTTRSSSCTSSWRRQATTTGRWPTRSTRSSRAVPARAARCSGDHAGLAGRRCCWSTRCDRADEEFEAFMLEVFSGLAGDDPRDRHDQGDAPAARHPDLESHARAVATRSGGGASTSGSTIRRLDKELGSSRARCRGSTSGSRGEIAQFMETLRQVRLAKVPGVAETLDWAQALASLHADHIDEGGSWPRRSAAC